MNKYSSIYLLVAFLCWQLCGMAQTIQVNPLPATTSKQVYVPAAVWHVPDSNNYNDPQSKYYNGRKAESDNVVVFWAKAFGDNPIANLDSTNRFNPPLILQECERFYHYYADTLGFIQSGHSVADTYKMLFYVFDGKDQTAYGGGAEEKIGVLWAPPARISKMPFGAVAHEMGHSFQYFIHTDGHWGFSSSPKGGHGQSIFEMTSQFMLWQVYPEWMTFENYHVKDFLKQTHYAFLHEINQYHSPFVLEYWSSKHGQKIISKIWINAIEGEDAVTTYKRISGIDQKTFNDEMFDAARRFVTWDLPRIKKIASPYANQHATTMKAVGNNWYRIDSSKCPQNYGYNAIPLKVNPGSSQLTLHFKSIAGAEGYRKINLEKAGWRYGLLSVDANGTNHYGDVFSNADTSIRYTVPPNMQYLWLVVSGAPTEHWIHLNDGKDYNDEQWPYEIKIEGASVE